MPPVQPTQTCPPNTVSYTVIPGDTLDAIARKNGTTVPAIEAANPGVSITYILPGQQICVPRQPYYAACQGGSYYVIRPGETLEELSGRYNVTLEKLLRANPHVNGNPPVLGQVICIPR